MKLNTARKILQDIRDREYCFDLLEIEFDKVNLSGKGLKSVLAYSEYLKDVEKDIAE